ncbi:MAG: hypothetical protein H0U03_09420 [Actinobacteria bacterium]|nr:hypothetical protein [Actinomycetota bacterium]
MPRALPAVDRLLDCSLTRFLEAAALLRLAEIHLPRKHGEAIAGALLRESERMLVSDQKNSPSR